VSRDICRTADSTRGANSAALLSGAGSCQGMQRQHKAVCDLCALCVQGHQQNNRYQNWPQQRSSVVWSRKLPWKTAAAQHQRKATTSACGCAAAVAGMHSPLSKGICRATDITRGDNSAALLLGARSCQRRQRQLSTNAVCGSLRASCRGTSAEQQTSQEQSTAQHCC
jgi:hypothetical protein